jgi:hypothetical protein
MIHVDYIKEVFTPGEGARTFVSGRSSAWLYSFKALATEYILETPFYDTMPPLHSTAVQVNAKLDELIPNGADADEFFTKCEALWQEMALASSGGAVATTYSDPWVGQVVLYLLAKEITQHHHDGYEARR